ncbi:MAG TPA: phosphate propanoyltransferase [Candidatus Bipolaricaulota bacterium]|nr:phosphate propanoyltransferase [Candidatus Bipolaricaulota bacterium]
MKIEISARHLHLCQKDLEKLFGKGYKLEPGKELSQHGEFASSAKVTLVGPKRQLENVTVIGPVRVNTQVEISRTDAFFLGSEAPLRVSGDVAGSGAIKIIGPAGEAELKEGLIVAKRHVHLSESQATELGLKNGDIVKVKVGGDRALVFDQVVIRVKGNFDQSFQIDTDEGNAADLAPVGEGELIIE